MSATANALVLHGFDRRPGASRWLLSATVIVGLHVGAIVAALALQVAVPAGTATPAIMIDMAPTSSAPQPTPLDLAPGPDVQQAEDAAPPEPQRQAALAPEVEATLPQHAPVAALPPEQKPAPDRQAREPAAVEAKRTPPAKPKRTAKLAPSDQPPAPRSSAAPRAERAAPQRSAANSGTSAAAVLPSYRALLAAHLQRFKQYPAASRAAGEQGAAMLSFAVGRNGQLLGSRLASSSGYQALDAEALAMVRRAQPLPPFPAELPQSSISFTVPVRFSVQ